MKAFLKHNRSQLTHYAIGIIIISYFLFKCFFFAYTVKEGVPPDEHAHLALIEAYRNSPDFTFRIPPDLFPPSQAGEFSVDNFLYHFIIGKVLAPFQFIKSNLFYYRLINIGFGFLNILVFIKLCSLIFKERYKTLFALIIYTNVLMFTFLTGSVNYDNLLNLFCILSILYLIKFYQSGDFKQLIWVGTYCFLGLLIKPSILTISIVAFPLLLYKLYQKNLHFSFKSRTFQLSLFIFLVCASISSAVILSNKIEYNQYFNISCGSIYGNACNTESPLSEWYSTLKEKHKYEARLNLMGYYDQWIDLMIERSYGIAAHQVFLQSIFNQAVIKFFLILAFIFTLFKKIRHEYFLLLSIFLTTFFVLLVYHNYPAYLMFGEIGAGVHGRYLFPVLSCFSILLVASCFHEGFSKYLSGSILVLVSMFFVYTEFPHYYNSEMRISFDKSFLAYSKLNNPSNPSIENNSIIYIDAINYNLVPNTDTILVKPEEQTLTISGWAIDTISQNPGFHLCFIINENFLYKCRFRQARPDISAHFNNSKYDQSGFNIKLEKNAFNYKINTLRLLLYNKNYTKQLSQSKEFLFIEKCPDPLSG